MSDNPTSTPEPTPPRSPRRGWDSLHVLVTLVAVLVLIAVGFVGAAISHNNNTNGAARTKTPTISVTATATVKGTPDTVSFEIGMQNSNANAKAALAFNDERVAALEKALMKHGVTKKEMQTSGLNITEETNNAGQVIGFTVEDDLTVTMHDLTKAGGAIESAATAAGNGVELNSITFSISNDSKLLAQARAKAMRNAHDEANDIAVAAGTSLSGLASVVDQENQSTPPPTPYGLSFATAAKAASVPVQAGSESISVQLSVVYSLAS
ncbi:MAG: SIMPL domain-containing protein [Acidimicrobiales bacterium]